MMDSYTTHLRHGHNYMRRNRRSHRAEGTRDRPLHRLGRRIPARAGRESGGNRSSCTSLTTRPHFPIEPPAEWLAAVKQPRCRTWMRSAARNVALVEHLDDGIGRVLADVARRPGSTGTRSWSSRPTTAARSRTRRTTTRGATASRATTTAGCASPSWSAGRAGSQPGSRCDYAGLNFDLFPTFLELAGGAARRQPRCRQPRPAFRRRHDRQAPRPLLRPPRRGPAYGGKSYEAIIRGDWKLLQNDPFRPLELYNLEDDPQEQDNVAATNPKVFQELAAAPAHAHIQRGGATPWQRPARSSQEALDR